MKRIAGILLLGLLVVASCDKVENIYPAYLPSTALNYDLFPGGGEQEYLATEWPTFTANTNTDRNVMIEDFTGHKCTYCPAAAVIAEGIEAANPGRVFVSTVHASPEGAGSFQSLDATFTHDFTNPQGMEIASTFGSLELPGSPFTGNPGGSVSRDDAASGFPVEGSGTWNSTTTSILSANDLKTNIQAAINYYPAERGLFVHTEIEVLDIALANELRIVVQLHEDSIIQPQKYPFLSGYPGDINDNYVHRDVMRGCIDGRAFGQMLDADHLDANGKYYFDYSYELPAQYNVDNMHLLIYVRDAVTEEIYQVIEEHLH